MKHTFITILEIRILELVYFFIYINLSFYLSYTAYFCISLIHTYIYIHLYNYKYLFFDNLFKKKKNEHIFISSQKSNFKPKVRLQIHKQ